MTTRFVVGVDLGTTNTVVASCPIDDATAEPPRILPIVVRTDGGVTERRSALRSSLYAPIASELASAAALPFPEDPCWIVGELAAQRGRVVPRRYVASAKSWLCHPGVDHHQAILPWGARAATTREDTDEDEREDSPSLSPVDASAKILSHVRGAWDSTHPDAPLHQQDVVLTVPASFDEVARELTLEAARSAGFAPRLLEEPQAAFYAWMGAAGEAGLAQLLEGAEAARILVVDIGGGTTDLSLLRVARDPVSPGGIGVTRIAVGRHLLLGGDNMDLALAMAAETRLSPGERLDPGRFSLLVSQCKAAKERLLGDAPDAEVPIALAPRGSALVGGTRRTTVTRDEARALILDGFFPFARRSEVPIRARGALVSFGLPFERDPAITRHVAAFVARHSDETEPVDAILFNGGVLRAEQLTARMVEVIASWQSQPPRVLPGNDPDQAVALGAVAFGVALRGRGRRIESRSARGYYIGLGAPGDEPDSAICVVPRGGAEATRFVARAPGLMLTLGRPARFDLWSSDVAEDAAGSVVALDPDSFARIRPLVTRVGAPGEKGEIAVDLEGEVTPVGSLDLACVEVEPAAGASARRFRLAFDLRGELRGAADGPPPSTLRAGPRSIVRPSDRRLEEACALLEKVYGKTKGQGDERDAKNLLRDLEKTLGERTSWPTDLARQLVDRLLPLAKQRRRSADHERIFFLLLGFCLRPGFGYLGDEARASAAFALFKEKVTFQKDARGMQQFWIAWRRIAGGLDEAAQTALRDELDRHLAPHDPRSRKAKPPKAEAEPDLIDLLSWLERVAPARRAELGGWLLERTWTDRDPRLRAALGRLGAREPAYASAHHVIAPRTAERWVDHLLREKWNEVPAAARAAYQIARVVGDRSRDLAETTRAEVAQRLEAIAADPRWIESVRDLAPRQEADRAEMFGEDLPPGLHFQPIDPAG